MISLPDSTQKNGFIYADSNNPTSFVNGNIQDTTGNALASTVMQLGLYGASVDTTQVGWVIWNDQVYYNLSGKVVNHEQDPSGNYYAHSKGLFGFDKTTGFWLAHSAPGFPYSHDISPSSWSFNHHQQYFAQHYFCTTFRTGASRAGVDVISQFLASYYIFLYDSNTPSYSVPASFSNLIANQYSTGTTSLTYRTQGGASFVGFGKNGMTGSDLYEDYIAPGLSCGLSVESWCGGYFPDSPGCQPSDCAGAPIVNPSVPQQGQSTYAYDSVSIENLDFGGGNYFNTKHNHCKFAVVTASCGSPWVCIADINRQTTQRQRGGGAICFKHSGFYGLISGGITRLNSTCPSGRRTLRGGAIEQFARQARENGIRAV